VSDHRPESAASDILQTESQTKRRRFLPLVRFLERSMLSGHAAAHRSALKAYFESLPKSPIADGESLAAYVDSAVQADVLARGQTGEMISLQHGLFHHIVHILRLLRAEGEFNPEMMDVEARGRELLPDWDAKVDVRYLTNAHLLGLVDWDHDAARIRLLDDFGETEEGETAPLQFEEEVIPASVSHRPFLSERSQLHSSPPPTRTSPISPLTKLNPAAPAFVFLPSSSSAGRVDVNIKTTQSTTRTIIDGSSAESIVSKSVAEVTIVEGERDSRKTEDSSEPAVLLELYTPLIEYMKQQRLAGARRVSPHKLVRHLDSLGRVPYSHGELSQYLVGAIDMSLIALRGPKTGHYIVLHSMAPLVWSLLTLRTQGTQRPSISEIITSGTSMVFPGSLAFRFFQSYLKAAAHLKLVQLDGDKVELIIGRVETARNWGRALKKALAGPEIVDVDSDSEPESDEVVASDQVYGVLTNEVETTVTLDDDNNRADGLLSDKSDLVATSVTNPEVLTDAAPYQTVGESIIQPQCIYQSSAKVAFRRFAPLICLLIRNYAVGKKLTPVGEIAHHMTGQSTAFSGPTAGVEYLMDARQLCLIHMQQSQNRTIVGLDPGAPAVWTLLHLASEGVETPTESQVIIRGSTIFAGTGLSVANFADYEKAGLVDWNPATRSLSLANCLRDVLDINGATDEEPGGTSQGLAHEPPPTSSEVQEPSALDEQKTESSATHSMVESDQFMAEDLGKFQPIVSFLSARHSKGTTRVSRSRIDAFFKRLGQRPYPTGKINTYLSEAASVGILRMSDPNKEDWVELLPAGQFCPLMQILRIHRNSGLKRSPISAARRHLIDRFGIDEEKVGGLIQRYETHGLVSANSKAVWIASPAAPS
jgi:hypothetical protein